MKSTVLFLTLGMALASNSFANTAVYEDNGKVVARLGDMKDAEVLYDALNVEATEARGGFVKFFENAEETLEIYCAKSKLPFGAPYTCSFSISAEAAYESNGRLMVTYHEKAEELYNALNLPESEGRSGYQKIFKTSDKLAQISCVKSKLPVGIPFSCTFSMKTTVEK